MNAGRRTLFRFPWRTRRQIVRDLEDEIAFHVDMRAQELVAAGLAPDNARRQAMAEFGDLDRTIDYCRNLDARSERETRLADRLAEWRQDLRYALRTIRRSPSFAVVSLLTLTAAIGANTAIFTVTRAVLLEPLPYGAPGSLVAVYERPRSAPSTRDPLSIPDFVDYRAAQRTLAGMAAYAGRTVTWRPERGDPELLDALSVTGNLFGMLQVRPALGRTFVPSDDPAAPKTILSYALWQTAFGGDSGIVGRTITLNDLPYVVLGVMPRDFTLGGTEAMWTLLDLGPDLREASVTRKQRYLRVIARLERGVTLGEAVADLQAISRRLQSQYPDANRDRLATLVPLHTDVVGDVRPALLLLQAAAALVLLIACVNLANVTLARTMSRRQELALRAALGAGSARLVRQIMTECVVLAVAGGVLGTVLAVFATRALIALDPATIPALFSIRPDVGVLMFGLAISAGTGLLFGVLPALDASRADIHHALKEGGRGASAGRGSERLRGALVVAQVGLAVVLLVGAGLLVRSFAELTRVRLGFTTDHVLTAEVRVSGERYDSAGLVNQFYDRMLDQVRRSPGVLEVGATMKLPVGGRPTSTMVVEGQPADPGRTPEVAYGLVRGDYFKALGIPLVAGRTFDDHDRPDGPGVVLVNAAAARLYFPNGQAVGRRVHLGPDPTSPWATVVGVVGDTRDEGFDVPPRPTVYAAHAQNTWWRSLEIVTRTAGDPRLAEPALRRAMKAADPTLALRDVRTLDAVLGSSLAGRRFAMNLVSGFAAVALLLAAVGIYGVLAFAVTRRTPEFGVRLALGATRQSILMLVVRQGLAWALLGVGIGIAGALAGTSLVSSVLYGVSPTDPATLAVAAAGLLAIVLTACLVPAMRATRVDPIRSMRAD